MIREAVIMAAGVGARLRPFTGTHPKSLLDIGGRTLMERHLANLEAGRVERTTIVIGHCGDQIRAKFGERAGKMMIRYIDNPRYTRGSILSMHAGLDGLAASTVFMDADVLYHPEILHRLLRSDAPGCFVLDPSARQTGEEMLIGTRAGRCLAITRRLDAGWDKAGEGVGFFSLREDWLQEARLVFGDFLRRGVVDCDYEDALNVLMQDVPCAFVETGGLPWTEIDFPEDVARAEQIFARLKAMGAEP
jgi:choline kinase